MWVSFVKTIQLRFIHFIEINFTLKRENIAVKIINTWEEDREWVDF
jgi:hypothetical protein